MTAEPGIPSAKGVKMPVANDNRSHEKKGAEGPIQLRFGSEKKVEVIDEDKHRFYTTVSEAAKACRNAIEISLWKHQFEDLLSELHAWCVDRTDEVESCFVSWGEGGLTVFVITTKDEYHFDLDDDLHALDLRLASVYPECPAEILQLPNGSAEELNSFFSPVRSVQAYGNEESASTKGTA